MDMTAEIPSLISSPERLFTFLSKFREVAYELIERVKEPFSPDKWAPPSVLWMILVKQCTFSE